MLYMASAAFPVAKYFVVMNQISRPFGIRQSVSSACDTYCVIVIPISPVAILVSLSPIFPPTTADFVLRGSRKYSTLLPFLFHLSVVGPFSQSIVKSLPRLPALLVVA